MSGDPLGLGCWERYVEAAGSGRRLAVKDLIDVAGMPTRAGSNVLADAPPADADAPIVARLREAGAVVVGITRVPELCLYAATDGPGTVTRNPWDTAWSPAGSSGGSAAAVAAGVVPPPPPPQAARKALTAEPESPSAAARTRKSRRERCRPLAASTGDRSRSSTRSLRSMPSISFT